MSEFVRLSQLRKLRNREQAAAVCYRMRDGGIEFLLIQTRGSGRWTFPKGSAEPGLSHAQVAALEAFEEAGVHGRIEQASFVRYLRRRWGNARNSATRAGEELAVNAYLCEVLRLGNPKESKRNRTWFSVKDAKQRLREKRRPEDGAEFARVVERAAARIQKLQGGNGIVADCFRQDQARQDQPQADRPRSQALPKDALQKVRFDFAEAYGRAEEASFMPYTRRQLGHARPSNAPAVNVHRREILPCEVLQFDPPQEVPASPRRFAGARKAKALGPASRTAETLTSKSLTLGS
ncbi:MAG: NUDIX domain-containing protein [Candidatus Sulfotelmatobacter sp.]